MDDLKVFIIDDDPAVRDALLTLADSIGLNASTFASADAFLAAFQDDQAGCLITDICLPGTDGMQLQQILSEREIDLPIIAMSAHGDIAMAVEMVRRGAIDFIEKPFRNHLVLGRIHEALEIAREQSRLRAGRNLLRGRIDSLTPREKQVLPLLLDGESNKQTARLLQLSPRTVETHRANILRKMQADSITALAQMLKSVPSWH